MRMVCSLFYKVTNLGPPRFPDIFGLPEDSVSSLFVYSTWTPWCFSSCFLLLFSVKRYPVDTFSNVLLVKTNHCSKERWASMESTSRPSKCPLDDIIQKTLVITQFFILHLLMWDISNHGNQEHQQSQIRIPELSDFVLGMLIGKKITHIQICFNNTRIVIYRTANVQWEAHTRKRRGEFPLIHLMIVPMIVL